MIVGAMLALIKVMLTQPSFWLPLHQYLCKHQLFLKLFPNISQWKEFPINGQWIYALSMVGAILTYVLVSLLGKSKITDLDKILHRGKYMITDDSAIKVTAKIPKYLKIFGVTNEFTYRDKLILFGTFSWNIFWFIIFVFGTVYGHFKEINIQWWASYWRFSIWVMYISGFLATIWLLVGGIYDLKYFFQKVQTIKRQAIDDGTVEHQENLTKKQEILDFSKKQ
jgi:hypothetical protein